MRLIVYSCNTHEHFDTFPQPTHDPKVSYVMFHSSDKIKKVKPWEYVKIKIQKNPLYTVKKYKISSHKLFSDSHVWFDCSMIIPPDIRKISEEFFSKYELIVGRHNYRKVFFDEIIDWYLEGKTKEFCLETCYKLINAGVNFNNFVPTLSGIIFRKSGKSIDKFNEEWWKLWSLIEHRDQIVLGFAVSEFKKKLIIDDMYNIYHTYKKLGTYQKEANKRQLHHFVKKLNIVLGQNNKLKATAIKHRLL